MTQSSLKVLYAIMLLADQGKPITVRSIAATCGWTGLGLVQVCLFKLRRKGLVSYQSRLWRTIRPTCRFIPVEQLEELP